MSDAQALPRWARLAAELRRLRDLAGLSQREIAKATGVSQTSVNRIELAGLADPPGQPPPWPVVERWAQAVQAVGPDLVRLRGLTEAARDEHSLYRNRMPTMGMAGMQEEVGAREAVSQTIRNFNPWGLPGLLQTPEYARRIFAVADTRHLSDLDAAVQARLARQAILAQPGRTLEFVLKEGALRERMGPDSMLVAQLEHLARLAALPTVSLSVIPSRAPAAALSYCGLVIYEDRADGSPPLAAIEVPHTEVIVDEPPDLEIVREWFDLLRRSALHGDEAVDFVHEIARSLS